MNKTYTDAVYEVARVIRPKPTKNGTISLRPIKYVLVGLQGSFYRTRLLKTDSSLTTISEEKEEDLNDNIDPELVELEGDETESKEAPKRKAPAQKEKVKPPPVIRKSSREKTPQKHAGAEGYD